MMGHEGSRWGSGRAGQRGGDRRRAWRHFCLCCTTALFTACGAGEQDAPLAPARPACPRQQTHAAALTNALALGAGSDLAAWLRSEPVHAAMRTLVGAVLGGPALVKAYGGGAAHPGTLSALVDLAAPTHADRLAPVLMGLAAGDDATVAACSHLRALATHCIDAASLEQLATWLEDPRLLAAAPALLATDGAAVAAAAAALGVPSRLGLSTLAGALLESAAHPNFQPDGLRALLVDAVAEASANTETAAGVPLLSTLVVALDVATRGLDGAVDPGRLEATRSLCACLVATDADADPAADGALRKLLIAALWPSPTPPTSKATPASGADMGAPSGDLAGAALSLAAGLSRAVAADAESLQAARALVTLAADADWLARAIPQALDLWRRGAVAGAVHAVAASLAAAQGGPCAAP